MVIDSPQRIHFLLVLLFLTHVWIITEYEIKLIRRLAIAYQWEALNTV